MGNVKGKVIPDCTNCYKFGDCDRGEAGNLCSMWQSQEPNPKGLDPNEAWKKGD